MSYIRIVLGLSVVIAAGCHPPTTPDPPNLSAGAQISQVTPAVGISGTSISVTVDGAGFLTGATVRFGTAWLTNPIVTPTRMSGTVSSTHVGPVDVLVVNPDGTGAYLRSGFTFELGTLAVTRLSRTSGITAGSDWLDIFGTFQRGVTVTIGGQPAIIIADHPNIFLLTPANPAGVADVVVTNPNGHSVTLRDAFTYTPPYPGSFNGTWVGYAGVDGSLPIQFTIEQDKLMSVKCESVPLRTFTVPAPVVNGDFSVVDSGGFEMTGSLISENWAGGLIRFPACANVPLGWRASK